MAKFRIAIPFMLRELVFLIQSVIRLDLGVPMNAELPPSTDEETEGKAVIHFPGNHFVLRVMTGRGHYGEYVRIISMSCKLGFVNRKEAVQKLLELERYTGPLEWTWKPKYSWDDEGHSEGKACFVFNWDRS